MSVGSVCVDGVFIGIASLRRYRLSVELGGQGRERGAGEHRLHRQIEDVADTEGQIEARIVVAPFQRTDRLGVDVNQLRELRPRHPPLGTQNADAVVDREGFPSTHRTHTTYRYENPTTCQVWSMEPTRKASRRPLVGERAPRCG